ncbi:MAG: hypothetical protein IKQ93_09445 [Candidatus Methanomethylophilaceae archaeon]|nr:hypothetical protein [Candidatus Methanomethylophilaceae archaeon]
MDYSKRMIIALAVVAVVLLSAAPVATESDADDTPDRYGTTFGITNSEINEFLEKIFGMNLKELLDSLAKEYIAHDVDCEPFLGCDFALSRDVEHNGGMFIITDRLSGYVYLSNYVMSDGKFPAAGTYEPKEGESTTDFIKRLFTTEATEQHSVNSVLGFSMTLDLTVETTIDAASGEVEDVLISICPSVSFSSTGNFTLDLAVDDDGNITSITITYDESNDVSDMYADFQIKLDVDDLKVLGEGTWKCEPVITESVIKAVVSKDMVGGVWELISSQMEEKVNSPMVELLIEIISSSDKKLDLFKTIESLTSNPIPDITFVADAEITDFTDEHGDRYVIIKIARDGGSTVINLPMEGYRITASDILDAIPESVLSKEARAIIEVALGIIGWESFDVADITDNPEKQQKIDDIHEMVDEYNKWNEDYEFKLPMVYLVTAIVVAILAIVVAALMWRGRI